MCFALLLRDLFKSRSGRARKSGTWFITEVKVELLTVYTLMSCRKSDYFCRIRVPGCKQLLDCRWLKHAWIRLCQDENASNLIKTRVISGKTGKLQWESVETFFTDLQQLCIFFYITENVRKNRKRDTSFILEINKKRNSKSVISLWNTCRNSNCLDSGFIV